MNIHDKHQANHSTLISTFTNPTTIIPFGNPSGWAARVFFMAKKSLAKSFMQRGQGVEVCHGSHTKQNFWRQGAINMTVKVAKIGIHSQSQK